MTRRKISTAQNRGSELDSRVSAKALSALRTAREIATTARSVGPGVYEINPAAMLHLREIMEQIDSEGGLCVSVSRRFRGVE